MNAILQGVGSRAAYGGYLPNKSNNLVPLGWFLIIGVKRPFNNYSLLLFSYTLN